MKVIIENLANKIKGEPEQVLPEGTTIRFEFSGSSLSCDVTEKGLRVIKNASAGDNENLAVYPQATNVVFVK